MVQLFATRRVELERSLAGDLDENAIRAIALPTGLVDVKVCAVDETWSGLKLAWRKERRTGGDGIGVGERRSAPRRELP